MKKIYLILITVIVTGLVVGGLTYYSTNRSAQLQKESLESQISELQSQVEELQQEDSSETLPETESTEQPSQIESESNLKTYQSSKYGYSFSYPKNWDFDSGILDGGEIFFIQKTDTSQVVNQPAGDDGPATYTVTVAAMKKNEYSSLDDYWSVSMTNKKSTLLGKRNAYSFIEMAAPSSGPVYATATYHNSRIYRVHYYSVSTKNTHLKYKSVYDNIVDSFKFI